MSPPNLKLWFPATRFKLSVNSYRVSERTTGEKSSRPMKAVPEILKATASPFCDLKVARRKPKLKRPSLTILVESVEVSVATAE